MRKHIFIAGLVVASALLTACGSGTPTRTSTTVNATVTATPTSTQPTDVSSPGSVSSATEPGDSTLTLTDTATYDNGVQVSLGAFTRDVSSDTASPAHMPYLRFALTLTNGSGQIVDASLLSVQCQYGSAGREGQEIFDSAAGLNGAPSTHVRAGHSITARFGCQLPRMESYIQIEVQPSFESGTAIFAGDVA